MTGFFVMNKYIKQLLEDKKKENLKKLQNNKKDKIVK